jgi:Domain of unknown function (DUF4082)/Bacterial Ig-like domain/Bacterial Ig domain
LRRALLLLAGVLGAALSMGSDPHAQCGNPILCENSLPGNLPSEWDITGSGDPSIQGFTTDISVDQGQIVRFKINTTASDYRLDIYRLGYYGGRGARFITTVQPTATLPQTQPACLTNATTGLIDCGNWAESASWTVPIDAVSGIYVAKLVREAGGAGSSHVVFVVRDDDGHSDLLFQTSDTTWQAYNQYGGNSLYVGSPAGRAYKVSYNRPITTRGTTPEDWVFNAEYPMVRWLEANGYNVSYSTGVDTDRRGAELLEHKVFMSVGHDEYWSAPQRANVEAARNAGVHLAFFSGNEVFWKTRWENSTDVSGTPYRTLVTYKETHANAVIDPQDPPTWTGTWRDPRFSPPADGGRPENALTGQIFTVNGRDIRSIVVPDTDGKMRFWRNTSIATLAGGASATLPNGVLGYEWDEDLDNGFRPAGLFRLSTSTYSVPSYLQDYGSNYATGTATHHLTLYRHSSGALVFGAGTEQWMWGLDDNHDFAGPAPDLRMQQATVNLFADMGAQAGSLQTAQGLVAASASTDAIAPTSTITAPAGGATIAAGTAVTITGTATDTGGGVIGGVEVSVDGGVTWHPANGRASWTYSWTATGAGFVTIKSRAVDDSGNLETPSAGATITVPAPTGSTLSIWSPSTVPAGADPDTGNVEIGTKFRSSAAGTVTGVRFYKFSNNTGTHIGSLWSATGTKLAGVTFSGETASGWQQMNFATPVAITANTTYVVSYHANTGHYGVNSQYFAAGGVTNGPLTALANGVDGGNGVYRYGTGSIFPNSTFNSECYWVDVMFAPSGGGVDTTPPSVSSVTPVNGAGRVPTNSTVTAAFSEAMDATTINTNTFQLRDPSGALVAAAVTYNSTNRTATLTPSAALLTSTTYTARVDGGTVDPRAKDVAGNALAADVVWSFTTVGGPDTTPPTVSSVTPASGATGIGLTTTVTATFSEAMDSTTINATTFELRAPGNVLVTATVTYNSASRTATLTPTAALTQTTTYTATVKGGATDPRVKDAVGNALASNFTWSFTTTTPDTTPPTVTGVTPTNGSTGVAANTAVTATFSEAMDSTTISTSSFELRNPSNTLIASTVTYSSATRTATLTPTAALANSTTYTATVKGGGTDPRVKDVAGNALASNFVWSFTTGAAPPPPPPSTTIWAPTATPAGADPDISAVEVGTKFRSDVAGFITGIRFYKFAANGGTHTGHLWSSTGTLLATATFTGETASGWQQVSLASPLAINANTTYIVSYHAPTGRYAVNSAYFAGGGVDNPPLHALANGIDGGNGVYAYGASGSFPSNTFNSECYWVDVVYATSLGPDTTPPVVAATSPASGATGFNAGSNVTATFSEAMDATTINASTFDVRSSTNAIVAGSVTYDSATRTATFDPTATLQYLTTYTATVRGAAGGAEGGADVRDLAGNAMAADYSWSFTTGPAPGACPCSIWNGNPTPAGADADPSAVEVGTKFQADSNGFITALRFYKFATNTGTHTGHLWSRTGTLLATAAFTGETASGWQQVTLANPISITANTTYVVSYHAPIGHYATNSQYFNTGVNNPPLRGLASGVDGGNGVYAYGASGTFPVNTFNAENYWVDVVFNTSLGPDTTPPTVASTTPSANATGVPGADNITATFSESVNATTVSTSTFELSDSNGVVPATVSYDGATRTAILDPTAGLAPSTTYTATVRGGATDPRIKDLAGNALAANFTWSFTTGAPPPPPPNDGPGGPILVVSSTGNPFSRYYAEILRAEGLNAFSVSDISLIDATVLGGYDVVILGEIPLTAAQVTMFTTWVNGGGNLIAMRPDKKLAGLLGLTSLPSTLTNAYLAVDTTTPNQPGVGLVNQSIQFHGSADVYTLSGATGVAFLWSGPLASTPNPAVSMMNVGPNGGHAAAFTYDLARSIVYTRQGNPAWNGQERDGFVPKRSDDLFFGASSTDGQPDWVNLDKVAIPQGDEQQRLLANLVLYLNSNRKPLPRFWYLPRGNKAVVVMTGDDHANAGTVGRFNQYKSASPAGCSVADWGCIRGTSYIYPNTAISNATAAGFNAEGFEIAVHISTNCGDYTPTTLPPFYTNQLASFASAFPSLPAPTTNRTHCIAWSDWTTQAQVELSKGIRLDTNYYYWPQSWVLDRPGFFTGSGIPMRFADTSGAIIDVYQATTQMNDEANQSYPMTVNALLDKAIGPEGYYGVFTANMHTDFNPSAGSDAIVASAQARNVPVITAKQLLTWLDGRNGSSFQSLGWTANVLTFTVGVGTGANGLQAMVPTVVAPGTLSTITLNGNPVTFTRQTIKGIEYAIFQVAPGTYRATYTP